MKFTFSFQRASCAKSWNMTAKIAENDARTSQVDQFAVVTARPKLERDQLSPHGWRARDTFAVYWAKRVRSQQKKKCYGVVSYECVKLIMYSDDRRSIAQQTSKTKFVRSKISYTTCEVTIDHVPSFGRAVTTANWSTWEVRASFSAILAVIFQLFAQLARWKLNVYFIGLQGEILQVINCEFSEKYCE